MVAAADGAVGGAWATGDGAADGGVVAVARAEIRVDSLPWAPAGAVATRCHRSAADSRSGVAVVVGPRLPSTLPAAAVAHWAVRRSRNTVAH